MFGGGPLLAASLAGGARGGLVALSLLGGSLLVFLLLLLSFPWLATVTFSDVASCVCVGAGLGVARGRGGECHPPSGGRGVDRMSRRGRGCACSGHPQNWGRKLCGRWGH